MINKVKKQVVNNVAWYCVKDIKKLTGTDYSETEDKSNIIWYGYKSEFIGNLGGTEAEWHLMKVPGYSGVCAWTTLSGVNKIVGGLSKLAQKKGIIRGAIDMATFDIEKFTEDLAADAIKLEGKGTQPNDVQLSNTELRGIRTKLDQVISMLSNIQNSTFIVTKPENEAIGKYLATGSTQR